jgi:CheY-like chemotaxis protein
MADHPKRGCALVVDDDADSREVLAILLRQRGFDVHTASNAAGALQVARAHLPEVIFLDIGMPSVSGYEVCRELRKMWPLHESSIYAVSGFSGRHHDELCSEAGFTAHFTKPLDPKLLSTLEEHVR